MDVNGDGVVSKLDYKNSEQDFENFYKNLADKESIEGMRRGFKLFWEEFIFRRIGHKDYISEEEFVTSLTKEYQTDSDALIRLARQMFGEIARCADVDNDGFLTYEEFTVLFKAFGYKDERVIREMYENYNPKEKGIGVMEFTESWVDTAVGLDKDKVSIPYSGFLSQLRDMVSI